MIREFARTQELSLLCGKLIGHYQIAGDVLEAHIPKDLSI